ncbi:MAG: response regulator transcription factor [Candidatus Galacturonibacter soehngenii]|nr:response regulator transcription factor [Candidatus Galacturonibacter soehngenii]
MNQILLLEDDENVNRGISFMLEKEGYEVMSAFSVLEARQKRKGKDISLIICDITLPDGSGLDFIREVRCDSKVHIICLTALDQEIEQIMGYEAGADDYITKPFSLSVLLLKVNAFFKKQAMQEEVICSGEIRFYLREMKVWKEGKEILLTKNEWSLLLIFLTHPKQILSKSQLLEQLFDAKGDFVEANTIAVNIRRLREKIEQDAANPIYIKNMRGMGYLWDKDSTKL